MNATSKIIGSARRYTGAYRAYHLGIAGRRVSIIAVHREGEILLDDQTIGRLRPDDVVEFAPLIREADGSERPSFVTSDGRPDELKATDVANRRGGGAR